MYLCVVIILTGTTNKQIARLKRILSVLVAAAVLLSVVTAVSGFCLLRNPSVEEPGPAVPTETTQATEATTTEDAFAESEEDGSWTEETVSITEETDSQADTDKLSPPVWSGLPSGGNAGSESGNTGSESGNTGSESGNTGSESGNAGIESGNTGGESGGNTGDVVSVLAMVTPEDVKIIRTAAVQTVPAEELPVDTVQAETDALQETVGMEEDSAATAETSALADDESETQPEVEPPEEPGHPLWLIMLFFGSAFLLLADIIAIFAVSAQIRKLSAEPQKPLESYGVTVKSAEPRMSGIPAVGRAHAMGMRNYQQDSFGQIPILKEQGLLAVVADGMGGLSDGEKVSQRIVMKALDYGVRLRTVPNADTLPHMINVINQDVNQMLGEEKLFKSGSTVVATMVVKDHLWWASVGDSRIYLYRNGYLNQLTRDHDLLQEWMGEVSKGRMTYEQAISNPDGRKLTSFIGMGKLRYIGYNKTPVLLQPGDRILLMSDGVYGTISNDEMAQILKTYPNVQDSADAVSRKIEAAKRRHQDNYTIMILGM